MDNYKDMYFHLFERICDINEEIQELTQECENMFINYQSTELNNDTDK